MKILIVEDSKPQRGILQTALEQAGYTILEAADGREGLEVARKGKPDLILLDMLLPRMDGPSVLAALKKDPATAHIPVVAISGLSQKNEEKITGAGAAAFYQKPESGLEEAAPQLTKLIRTLLAESRQRSAAGPR
jgi:two-component system, cell cycle response regulator DivK